MRIVNGNPELLSIGWVVASLPARIPPRIGGLSAAFFVKASWKLSPDAPAEPWPDGPLPPLGDLPMNGDPALGLAHASDFVPYKPHCEFLLTGTAHAPAGAARPKFHASARVGSWKKEILVFGPRTWREGVFGGAPGEPETVASVPLTYGQAWGGEGYDLNPLGVGRDTPELPSLELPSHRIDDRRARVAPACFAPIARSWAQRASKTGTYGGGWTEERWPWFPDDFDYSYFNAAPSSQWLGENVQGDEELIFDNLHPEHPEYAARLPGLHARCFVTREESRSGPANLGPLEEVAMTLDTICVDMDRELLTLVWRGRCPVRTIKLTDIDGLIFFTEPLGAESTVAEVRERLEKGLNPPPEIPAGLPIESAPLAESIELEILKARTQLFGSLAAAYADLTATAQTAANPKEFTEDMRELVQKSAAEAAKTQSAMAATRPVPADPLAALPADIREKTGIPFLEKPAPEVMEKETSQRIDQLQKERDALVQRFAPGPGKEDFFLDGRLRIERLLNGDAVGADLSGVDFSGLELPGAKFAGALLAGASFAGCRLLGADFSGADLSGANFSSANLHLANFCGADLHEAVFAGANMRKVFLKDTRLLGVVLDGLDLSESIGPHADFSGASLRGTVFAKCNFPSAGFSGASVEGADFSDSLISFGDFRGTNADGARFTRCQIPNFRAGEGASFAGADLRECAAPESLWENSNLSGADFVAAKLDRARFCEAVMSGANFDRAELCDAVLEDAVLIDANLSHANLLRVIFDRADLTGASMDDSNLYEASFWEATLVRATWYRAFVRRTLLDL